MYSPHVHYNTLLATRCTLSPIPEPRANPLPCGTSGHRSSHCSHALSHLCISAHLVVLQAAQQFLTCPRTQTYLQWVVFHACLILFWEAPSCWTKMHECSEYDFDRLTRSMIIQLIWLSYNLWLLHGNNISRTSLFNQWANKKQKNLGTSITIGSQLVLLTMNSSVFLPLSISWLQSFLSPSSVSNHIPPSDSSEILTLRGEEVNIVANSFRARSVLTMSQCHLWGFTDSVASYDSTIHIIYGNDAIWINAYYIN